MITERSQLDGKTADEVLHILRNRVVIDVVVLSLVENPPEGWTADDRAKVYGDGLASLMRGYIEENERRMAELEVGREARVERLQKIMRRQERKRQAVQWLKGLFART